MDAHSAGPRRSKPLFWALVGASVLNLLALLPAVMFAMVSPMASDSGLTTSVWIFIVAAMSLPIALIACPLLGWIAYVRRWNRSGWVLVFLPLLWPSAMLGAIA